MMQIITFEEIFGNTDQLEWEKEAYQEALNDDLDIEAHPCMHFHVFGNEEQKAFYTAKWKESYEKYCGRLIK